ncbi:MULTISPECIES: efflux RND transporter permease subunit [Sulfurimonas]|uniref:Efflux RND transporter permease subunit n=1 Tax=Sulfurimonas diazotrophicus TaxID=3131939 RepID=A0ABZ3HCI3_9BACT
MYKFAINRPITTLMYVLTLVVFGLMSFKAMPAALFPNVDFPIVTVKTVYPGAEPTSVESQITDKIEEAVSGINGIDTITSTSSDGVSVVMVKFLLERKIDEAANDVRDKVSAVKLPVQAEKPLVSKLDIGAAPVINVFLAAKEATPTELMLFADEKAKPAIQRLSGVGAINIIGYRDREIRIYPDPYALNKYGITVKELNDIISKENVKIGGGKLEKGASELIIKTEADAVNIDDLLAIKIKDELRLADLARVEDALADAKSFSSYDGKAGVMLEVQKISGTNTLDVIKLVKDAVPGLQRLAGDKIEVKTLNDTSPFIIHSLEDVEFDLVYGALLAALIIFVFLRNVTITLVASLAIPTSIIGTFALMDYMGFDLNKLTLIGLTLAIGILIDDAIVVIENIYKKMEAGMGKFDAAVEGTKEMAFAILAISSMLLAVFIPVSMMSGIVGKFFNSFAMTVAFAIVISYTIAMTFIPSLSARVLHKGESRFYDKTEFIFVWLDRAYAATLRFALRFKVLNMVAVLVIFIGSLSLFPKIGMDFVPKEDKAEFEVKIEAKPGISLEEMLVKSRKVEALVNGVDQVEYTTLGIGYNSAQEINKALLYVKLTDKTKRSQNQEEIIQALRGKLKGFDPDLFITAAAIPNIKGAGVSVPYQIVLKGDSFDSLTAASDALTAYLAQKQGFVDIDTNLEAGKPELQISILRENANRLGVRAEDIAKALATAFSSDLPISQYEENGKLYDITLRFDDAHREDVEQIKKMELRTPAGDLVSLDGLVTFENGSAMAAVNRFDRERQVTVFADLFGLDLGGAVSYTMAKIDELMPEGVNYRFTGFAEEMAKTGKAFVTAIGLTIIMIYIILAILYESLIQPVIIMMALPLSITGVLIALFLSGQQFSLFVMIGFFLLMGMVGKNAVLLVDFANVAVEKGREVNEALLEAGEKRLRPILMTTFAMVFAMLPLAFGSGFGSETKSPMAIAVIGGLISSMILTLVVVPIIYRLLYPLDRWLRSHYERRIGEA